MNLPTQACGSYTRALIFAMTDLQELNCQLPHNLWSTCIGSSTGYTTVDLIRHCSVENGLPDEVLDMCLQTLQVMGKWSPKLMGQFKSQFRCNITQQRSHVIRLWCCQLNKRKSLFPVRYQNTFLFSGWCPSLGRFQIAHPCSAWRLSSPSVRRFWMRPSRSRVEMLGQNKDSFWSDWD